MQLGLVLLCDLLHLLNVVHSKDFTTAVVLRRLKTDTSDRNDVFVFDE